VAGESAGGGSVGSGVAGLAGVAGVAGVPGVPSWVVPGRAGWDGERR
jgi:hypothetical protein